MTFDPSVIAKQLRKAYPRRARRVLLQSSPDAGPPPPELAAYKNDPVGFCRDVLGEDLTPDQQEIIKSLPGRVKVNSGHSVGKTHVAACAVIWWVYTRNPSIVITTAPKQQHVESVMWGAIRLLISRAKRKLPDYLQPKAAKLYDTPDHWAEGTTSSRGEAFQGQHPESFLIIFDEAEGLDPFYWQTTDTMYQPGADHGWLAIGNPITTSSQSYVEDRARGPDGKPKWKLFTLSALDHPNIAAQLRGDPLPYPRAVTIDQVDQWVQDWADPIAENDRRPNDFEWRPGTGKWYRPSPLMLARGMGIRPTEGVDTVWGISAWNNAIRPKYTPEHCWINRWGITMGMDSAAFGDDYSVIHVRSGGLSLHHEAHNGWSPRRLADKIKELCVQWAAWYNAQAASGMMGRPDLLPSQVNVIIELDVSGADVLDQGVNEYGRAFGNWGGLKVAESSDKVDQLGTDKYYNVRSEIWHTGAIKAAKGEMDLSRLPQDVLRRLQDQLLTVAYKPLPAGTLQVEEKAAVKLRLRRSPDDADALLVCYTEANLWSAKAIWKHGSVV